jgi:hypothetical protein
LLNSAQVGPADIFAELGSLLVGETKLRFRKDAEIEREDWSARNISPGAALCVVAIRRSLSASWCFGSVAWAARGPITAPEGREKRARLGLTITAWFDNHGDLLRWGNALRCHP